jgi:hypothetical protein
MFIPCNRCKQPFSCDYNDQCRLDTLETIKLNRPKELWSRIYPDRRAWEDLEEDTRKEWTRFTEIAFAIFTEEQEDGRH